MEVDTGTSMTIMAEPTHHNVVPHPTSIEPVQYHTLCEKE